MSKYVYLPSTTAGKTWSLYTYKPQGRPAYAQAIEGELQPDTGTGFTGFSFVMFQARQRQVKIDGPATAKKKAEALKALVELLKAEGLVEAQAAEAA